MIDGRLAALSSLASRSPVRHTKRVPEFCTCGAELPPDARFCHKCGKPQREELEVVVEQPPAPPEPAAPPEPPPPVRIPIGFRNPLALRIGLISAAVSLALTWVFLPACPIWLIAAGFVSVYRYHRYTGEPVSVRSGARMGWFTGLIGLLLASVPFGLGFAIDVSRPDRADRMRDALKWYPAPPAVVDQTIVFLQSPEGIAIQILTLLFILFVLFTLFPLIGGALGAKVLSKD